MMTPTWAQRHEALLRACLKSGLHGKMLAL
jgi:hypothetical protein